MRVRRNSLFWLVLLAVLGGSGSISPRLSAGEQLPITRLAQISFQVSDLQKARQYYTDLMGFEEAFEVKDAQGQPRSLFFKVNDDQFLEFSAGAKEGEFQLTRVSFLVPDIQQAREMLKARDLAPDDIRKEADGNPHCAIRDPDGTTLDFVQYLPDSLQAKARGKALGARRAAVHLQHAGLAAEGEAKAMAFYRDKLGFWEASRGGQAPGETRWIIMNMPGTHGDFVELMVFSADPATRRHHLSFAVPDIQQAHERLLENGMPPQSKPFLGKTGQWFLNLRDPNGIRVEFMEVEVDFNRAQQLFNRSKRGEKLSPEDQAYLDRAQAERRKAQGGRTAGPGGKGKGGSGLPTPPPPRDSTGLVPLNQMTARDQYQGQDGGLYGGGKNEPPPVHLRAALAEVKRIVPLDENGRPSPKGKIVLLSLGMSNTTMEFSVFKKLAEADPAKSPWVTIVDAAQSGKDAALWNDDRSPMWQIAEDRIKQAGVTPLQVEAVWCKQARIGPARYGEFPKHNEEMNEHMVNSLQIAKQRYPNLRIVYLSTRIYGGYALTGLNPEPYAYENAFAIRDLILRQIKGDSALNCDPAKGEVKAPLLLWGPYLWADGMTPRKSDGLVWKVEDFAEKDRTHPSVNSGREKVARLLLNFLKEDPTSKPWFTSLRILPQRE